MTCECEHPKACERGVVCRRAANITGSANTATQRQTAHFHTSMRAGVLITIAHVLLISAACATAGGDAAGSSSASADDDEKAYSFPRLVVCHAKSPSYPSYFTCILTRPSSLAR